MDWRQFHMHLGELDPDAVEAVLFRHGALSVELSDAGDDPVLEPARGETPLWPSTAISALFSKDADLAAMIDDLRATFGLEELPAHRDELLADRPWEHEWRRDFGPRRFGRRLWVTPEGGAVPEPGAVLVTLDPGLAFGTGTHATTAMCLEWLDGQRLDGTTMLDFGCGSGILAIAALKLGCRTADAVDNDPQAVRATLDNARRNGVHERLAATAHAERARGPYDVVVANILARPLVELAPAIGQRLAPGGRVALSGILSDQTNEVRSTYGRWIDFAPPTVREQGGQHWVLLSGSRGH